MSQRITPPHPGETIKEDYLVPLNLSVNQLAKLLGIGAARVNDIVRGRRGITADIALRLARFFGTSPQFWMTLQSLYDLRTAEQENGAAIAHAVKPMGSHAGWLSGASACLPVFDSLCWSQSRSSTSFAGATTEANLRHVRSYEPSAFQSRSNPPAAKPAAA